MSDHEYEQREQRLLDAAAELILRWGAKRVTIDEVARRARIGKGTVYLHFESRSRLLGSVLMRESLAIADEVIAAVERDPAAVLPAEQARITYLATRDRPLTWAMVTRDREVLGELAHEQAVEPLWEFNRGLGHELLRLSRDHGLLRADLGLDTVDLMLGAIQAGFYLHPTAAATDPEATAAALHDAVAAAVQARGPFRAKRLAAVAAELLPYYRELRDRLAEEVARRPTRTQPERLR